MALLALCLNVAVACAGRSHPTVGETPTAPPSTTCLAPALTPEYLPDGVRPAEADPIFGVPERVRTWTKGDVLVQLGEGFSGDHGDEPRLKQVTVRDTPDGHLLTHEDPSDGSRVVSVDWEEDTRCGPKQYIVVTKGLSEEETLKIARHLEGSTR